MHKLQKEQFGDFYPRPPRGGRHRKYVKKPVSKKFLSTPSARRATPVLRSGRPRQAISIHALREEGDRGVTATPQNAPRYFYPRPPRGGRLLAVEPGLIRWEFLSTPSARRATKNLAVRHLLLDDFYPRPPRGGRPDDVLVEFRDGSKFLSTPSARRATTRGRHRRGRPDPFLSTPSARRAT